MRSSSIATVSRARTMCAGFSRLRRSDASSANRLRRSTSRTRSRRSRPSLPVDAAAAPARFERAIAGFDAANAADPHGETVDGVERPKELVYAERMSAMLDRFAPDAPEVVRLAARCQHIERWRIPRT